MGILSGYLILDYTDEKAALCIKTLADMGAEIVRVNPEEEQERFRDLLKRADILIESSPPDYMASRGMGYQDLDKINPRLIMASITPFGQSAPYKDFKSNALTIPALGGWLSVTGGPQMPLKLD